MLHVKSEDLDEASPVPDNTKRNVHISHGY